MDMSRHASPEARKYPPTSLHDDLVEVLPLPEFAPAMRVSPAVVALPLLVAGDGRYPLPEVLLKLNQESQSARHLPSTSSGPYHDRIDGNFQKMNWAHSRIQKKEI
jgi:hypothetical protein